MVCFANVLLVLKMLRHVCILHGCCNAVVISFVLLCVAIFFIVCRHALVAIFSFGALSFVRQATWPATLME